MNTLKAEKRNMTTKAKKLRREGFVTGNLFGREITESIPLQMDKRAVDQLLKDEGKGGQVMLEVNGQTYDALIKEVDYNPLKGYVDEIDFQALVSNEKVHSTAEVHLINLEKLAAGVPQQMLHEISWHFLLHWKKMLMFMSESLRSAIRFVYATCQLLRTKTSI